MNVNSQINTVSSGYDVKKLGKQDFLKLFVTQLQYQDPLSPLKNEEFISQLAQFSSLEELGNIREEIANLNLKNEPLPFLYADMIGKTVKTGGENPLEGKVVAVNLSNNSVSLKLDNNKEVNLNDIIEIK